MFKFIIGFLLVSSVAFAQTFLQPPNLIEVPTLIATAGSTTTFTNSMQTINVFTGTSNQTAVLPNATSLQVGRRAYISNESTGTVTLNYNGGSLVVSLGAGSNVTLRLLSNGTAAGTWDVQTSSSGSVTSISVASSNGFTGSSSGGQTPTLTLATSITGLLKGNGTAISAASAGTDYVTPSGNITGNASTATALATSPTSCASNTYATTIDTGANLTCSAVSAANGLTGLTGVANGGTGRGSLTNHAVLIGAGTTAVTQLSVGASNNVLIGNSSADPSFLSVSGLLDAVFGTTQGAMLYRNSSVWTALSPGTSGTVLTSGGASANLSWTATGSPLTTLGDTYVYSTTNARQAVPGDNGRLVPDSAQTTGWRSASYTTNLNGKPGKNYIQYADFENGATTGWTLGTTGTLTNGLPTGSPTFGSGASGNLSLALESSGQLAGADSLGYVSSAATTAGNMVASSSYAIDAADQAKVLTVKFYYKAAVGPTLMNMSGTSSNSYAWALWDVTNSSWLSSAGNFCTVQNSGVGYCTGTAQTNATTANIRLVIYNANATSSGAATLYLDDFYVGPQTAPVGPARADDVAYTPTFTNFGTVSNVKIWSARDGDHLLVHGTFTAGTVVGSTATMTLGYNGASGNVSTDTTKVTAGDMIGKAGQSGSATTYFTQSILATSGTTVNFGSQNSTTSELTPGTGQIVGNSATMSFFFSVPIVGWSSNSTQSSDTDTRVVAMQANNASATVTSSYSDVTWSTVVNDTHGAMGAISYTIPISGYYDVASQVTLAGTQALNGTAGIEILKNGSIVQEQDTGYAGAVTANNTISVAANGIKFNAGDTVKIDVKSSATLPVIADATNGCFFTISRRSGSAVITADASVNARYHAVTATVTSSASLATYTTKDFDTANAYNSGTYTVPISGKYQVNAAVVMNNASHTAGNNVAIQIYKNGSAYSNGSSSNPAIQFVQVFVNDIVQCNTGDTITIQVSDAIAGTAIAASNTENFFSISRVGN